MNTPAAHPASDPQRPASPLRVALVDLWQGPGHAYYTGPLCEALSRRDDLAVGLFHNSRQDLSLYGKPAARFAVNAPTGLDHAQWGRVARQPFEFFRVLAGLLRFQPDVVHFVFGYPWFTAAAPALALWRPFAHTLHDVTPHTGEETLRNRAQVRMMTAHAQVLFVHGEESMAAAARLYPDARARLVNVPHGHFDFLNKGKPAKEPAEPATFLFFGRILPYKGLGVALAALERIAPRIPQAKLIVAGSGSLADHAKAIERLAPRVEVINRRIEDDELARLMARSAAVLVPYVHASGSGVVSVASAFARPCIASRLGGLIDMVRDGETGWLFEAGRAEALAACMRRVVETPGLAADVGARARRHALDAWSWDGIAARHADAYRKVARTRRESQCQN